MKKPRKPAVPPAEAELFRASMSDVVPLRAPARAEVAAPSPPAAPIQRMRGDATAPHERLRAASAWEAAYQTGEDLAFLRNGVQAQTLRQLRRGHWAIQDEIDLHGMTVEEARAALAEFLDRGLRRGLRCLRIVHGKGLRSPNREPVLKRKVGSWLVQREEILAFCQAPQAGGGGGAALVLLRGVSR